MLRSLVSSLVRRALPLLMVVAFATVFGLLVQVDAQAQGGFTCQAPVPGPGTTVVSNEAQFNQAIACYNQATVAGSYLISIEGTIRVVGEFVSPTGEIADSLPITQMGTGFDLEIRDGALEGGGTSIFDGDAVLLADGTGDAPVRISDTVITGGFIAIRANRAEVEVDNVVFESNHFGVFAATSTVRIENSSFRSNAGPAVAVSTQSALSVGRTRIVANAGVGITSTDSSVAVEDSFVSQNDGGINVASGPFTMVNSTVERAARGSSVNLLFSVAEIRRSTVANNGNIGVNASGATVLIANSTIVGNAGLGLRLDDLAPTQVLNSTIADNGLGAFSAFNSQLTAGSSFINGCLPGQAPVDGGGNTGTCFGSDGVLGPLMSNGCEVAQARAEGFGCVETTALPPGSSAVGAGDCSAPVVADQRGITRTPAELGCDAGAYEAQTYFLTIEKTVVGVAPSEGWSFSAVAVERCFAADLLSTAHEVAVPASGGSVLVEVYEGCEVTVTEAALDGFEPALIEQTVIVNQDQLVSFTNTQLPVDQDLVLSTTVVGEPATATFIITPSAGCVAALELVDIEASGQATVEVADVATTTASGCTYFVDASTSTGHSIVPASQAVSTVQNWRAEFVVTQLPQRTTLTVVVDATSAAATAPVTVALAADAGCLVEPDQVTFDAPGEVEVTVTDVAETTAEPCNYAIGSSTTAGFTLTPTQPQTASAGARVALTLAANPTPTPTPTPTSTTSPAPTATTPPRTAPIFEGAGAGIGVAPTTVPLPTAVVVSQPVAVAQTADLAVTGSTALLPITLGLAVAGAGAVLVLGTRRRSDDW